ncbi:MAG: methyltransferase domain-containing protein [Chloroflexales bacterium]|nr:methyltransferase domain-containing protein [Chloroflexales bacterium]
MYIEALAYLTCPRDPEAPLELERGVRLAADGELLAGRLRCPACGARYPIDGGIADLLGPRALPDSIVQVTNFLPPIAWGYERAWRPRALTLLSGEPFGYARELPLIVGLAAPERGGLCVDVACSNGLYARALARAQGGAAGHVIGVDHALPMLRQARAFARAEGLRISYVRARAQALPLASGAAAVVAMGGSLNEIGDIDQALRELRRTLASSGRCAMMCLAQSETGPGRALQGALGLGGVRFPPLDALNRRAAVAGLRLRSQWRYGVVVVSLLTR